MTSYGKHGSQRNQLLPTHRAFFNYGNAGEIGGYNSFFSGTAEGGDIVPENTLVLTNDNSTLLYASGYKTGFDTLYESVCVFNTAGTNNFLAASRNASAVDGNNKLTAQPNLNRLSIEIDAASSDGHVYAIESMNYLKISPSGRTFVERQGIFEHTGDTDNTTSFEFVITDGTNTLGVSQNSWNIDTFIKGVSPNPSGIGLDFKAVQTLVFSFYDKDIGDVLCGFLVDNTIFWAHRFKTNNEEFIQLDPEFNKRLKFGNLNIPIRDDGLIFPPSNFLRRVGVYNNSHGVYFSSNMNTTSEPNLIIQQYAHSSVAYTIGSSDKKKRIPFVAGTEEILKTVNAPNIPLFSVKAANTFSGSTNRTVFNFDEINIHASGANLDEGCYIKVIYNGSLTGDTFSEQPNSHSALLYDIDATAISAGTILYSGVIYADQVKKINKSDLRVDYVNNFSRKSITVSTDIGSDTLEKDDILTVVASPLTGTASILVGATMEGGEIG